MTELVIKLYRTLAKNRALFYTLLIATSALFVFLGSKVVYEEDISKLLPSTDESKSAGFAFNNLKVKDKIFIEFLLKDTTQYNEETYYTLAEAADSFADSVLLKDTSTNYIADLTWKLDDYLLQDALGYLFENVPQVLESKFYPALDSILNPTYADAVMAQNEELLSSAQGMFYYDIVRNDPLAIRNIFMQQNKDIAGMMGGAYKVVEGHFFTPDSTVALAFLSPNFKSFDSKQGTWLVEMLEEEIAEFEAENPEIEILFHGAPVQSVFNSRQIKSDLATTLSFSLVLICLIIWFCFRNKSTLLMLLVPVVYGAFFALATIYLIKGGMSLMALGIGAIVLGVALSYCLHVLTHYKYVSDPETVLREQTKPVIMGSLTTIGAFAGLLFTKSELLSDFGLFASLGMVGTTVFCLVFLPHFFNPENNRINQKAFNFIEKLNTYPFEKQTWLVVSVRIIFAVCLFTGRNVGFDSNLRNIGHYEPDVMRSSELLAQKTMPGMESKFYAVLSKDLDSALTYNIALEKKCRELAEKGLIKKYTNSAMLLLPSNVIEERIALWKNYWTPEKVEQTRKLINRSGKAQGFKDGMFEPFMELTQAEFEANSLIDAGIIPEGLQANLVECTDSTWLVFTSAQALPEDMLTVSNTLVKETEGIPSNAIIVVDPFFYTQNMVELLNDDFNVVLGISSLFVLIVLLLSFRNLAIALIAFLPMSMSWYIVLGVMGMFGLEFNLINIVISTFIFGIGVDYSIFVMDGLLGKDNPRLLTFHKTAIFFSAVVLILSIASLMFAVHPAISSIGLSTLIGMASTIAITYTLEPFLFNVYKKWKDARKK
ncbi:MAG: MMPL family transporter [Bacteroidales bacterium]|nr:MMPL family transporter [Bacteroidales bacterium]